MTEFIEKLDGESLLGHTLWFQRVATEKGFTAEGGIEEILKESAQVSAQAAAIVIARINKSIGSSTTELKLEDGHFSQISVSPIIKISGVFDRQKMMTQEDFTQIYEDMEEELMKHGDVERIKILRNGEEMVGAEVGSVFAFFDKSTEAESAMQALKGRIYDGREIRCIFVSKMVLDEEIKLG
jgi:hypothetical protein